MISVAIATFNGSKYIHELLQSIHWQSVQADEVIISDDCSTDDTVEKVKKFIADNKLHNWQVFVHEENMGFADNFFSAIKKTKGDIIFIADQDDAWDKQKVEIMASVFEEKKAAALSSSSIYIDHEGKPTNIVISSYQKKTCNSGVVKLIPFNSFIGKSVFAGCTMCIGNTVRNFLKKNTLPPLNKSLGHDWLCSVIASLSGGFYHLDKPLLHRRIHDANASLGRLRKKTVLSSSNEKRNKSLVEIINAHRFILENPDSKNRITARDRKKLYDIIRFFKKRLRFTTSKNIFIWLALLLHIRQYCHIGNGLRGAMHFYIADLFYAFGINWKIKNPEIKTCNP